MLVLLFFSLCFILLLFFLSLPPLLLFLFLFLILFLLSLLFLFSSYSYSVSIFYMIFSLKRYKKTAPSGRNGAAGKPIKSGVCGLLATGTARRYQ